MPIYEYQCKKCGEFEVMQRITEKPLGRCPTCRGKVTKLMSSTSFQLKGTGWYATDYGRGGSKRDAKSDTKTESQSDSKAESKSDSNKTESKSDGKTESASSDTKKTKPPEAAAA